MTPRRSCRAPSRRGRTRRGGSAWPPGRRTLWLLFAGSLWIVPALADTRFVAALFLWDALVIAAWLVDLRRVPPPDQLLITRRWLGATALGVPAAVEVVVDNQSRIDVRATLVDAVPWQVRAEPASVSLTAAAGQESAPHVCDRAGATRAPGRRPGARALRHRAAARRAMGRRRSAADGADVSQPGGGAAPFDAPGRRAADRRRKAHGAAPRTGPRVREPARVPAPATKRATSAGRPAPGAESW